MKLKIFWQLPLLPLPLYFEGSAWCGKKKSQNQKMYF